MTSPTNDPSADSSKRSWSNWLVALFLFATTAAIVIWQNSRLGVLWDLSYILENSYRISAGDVPYRDFPFPYAPITFLIQAAIIKLAGRAVWHHIVYSAVMGGIATVLTWRIVLVSMRERVSHARLLAFLLGLPVVVLGIYSIFPHPFYDPDCTLAVLLSLLLLLQLDRKPSVPLALLTGATLVLPLFVKQNIGLAFIVSTAGAIAVLFVIEAWQRRSIRVYVLLLVGMIAALGLALLLIQRTAGLHNYWHWTIQFAASRRTPARAEMIGIYASKPIILWLGLIGSGVFGWRLNRNGNRVLAILSGLLIAAPFTWPAIYLLCDPDASERADRLLALWPVLLICSFVAAVLTIRQQRGISRVLPFIIIATIHGAFMSQQLWGSTYAIWPLFIILLAGSLAALARIPTLRRSWSIIPMTATIVLSLLISGGSYVRSHERLTYANLDDGPLEHSTLPPLRGLSVRGDWIPSFEELVRYSDREIPRDDGLLLLPGEDLFYYTTGRQPRFPVLLFDHTVNPYTPEEILKLCRERNIRWLIVKQDLQDEDDQIEQERDKLVEVLEQDYEQVENLDNYDVYRKIDPADKDDDDK